jgi:hypothetical protein
MVQLESPAKITANEPRGARRGVEISEEPRRAGR